MKINIENYENMTPEEKVAALEAYEPDMSGYVAKSVFDKKASEAAELSKQLKSRMTEDEAKAAKDAEERAALIARVQELEHKEAVSTYINSYLAMGYDEKTAKSSAEALAKGDMETVFANQRKRIEGLEKDLKAEKLKNTPAPVSGSNPGTMTLEDFRKLSPQERHDFSVKNPEEYKNLYGGN